MLANRYGHFERDGASFVITEPVTPKPWVNVISNGRFGLVISQSGGGFSWCENSQLNVLTRWEMDLVRDAHGKFLYLAEPDAGTVWSAAPAPCGGDFDAFRCEHTLGSTTFVTEKHNVRTSWTLAVAPSDDAEVWRVELTNLTDRDRVLRLSSAFDWCCGVAPDSKREFHRLFFNTEYDRARRAIVATKNMWDVPARHDGEHWNRPWPYVAAHAVSGPFSDALAIADRVAFLGRAGDPARPRAMTAARCEIGRFGRFGDACAALGGTVRLGARATQAFGYVITIGSTREAALALVDRFTAPGAISDAIAAAARGWTERIAPTRVATERPEIDLLCNHWLPYQAISGRLWGRTGYYQQSGAFGFRDQLQDSQVWLTLDPARCREQILLHAGHQFADGSVYHWWHPLTETGLRTGCSDDYLWLPFLTCAYVRETGDASILDATAPFVDASEPTTLREHCRRAIERSFSRMSPRGIPLIGACDWNDGLSAMGVDGRGESFWLGMFLARILEDFAGVLHRIGEDGTAREYLERRRRLIDAINAHAWDGAWYRYGTRDDGAPVGSRECAEGRLHLNAQTWAILSGVADSDRAGKAWDAVTSQLLTEFGPLLLSPAYTVPDGAIGYITRYAPGSRENGGVYMHAATWALAAACRMGDAASAWRIWLSIAPPTRCAAADAYEAEPYVLPGNVDGPLSDAPGRAGWTWYTGSAQWLRTVVLESMLGIAATWEGLSVAPCAPAEIGKVDVIRRWRGCAVRVRFNAGARAAGTAPTLTVDGRKIDGTVITPDAIAGRDTIDVRVSWDRVAPSVVETKERPRRTPV